MYLQRIELQGFKSFASKTVLEFPAVNSVAHSANNGIGGVTAIVGPNGSGKSNVVDAVRWVLGEQSLKLLRGKKATDVIFAGSAQKSQLGLAEVSLYLNNEDRLAPVDYSEIVITRKLYLDGDSDYLINKQTVRLFDVVMLLARANFGQNTYSVIGQGMVDRIVNYSAQERKDFFDEATGVKQFQIKRDRSVSKLKKSRENLERVKTLLQELDPHLKSLTRQVNRLQKRKEVEIELRDLQIQYYGRLWLDLDSAYQIQAGAFALKEKDKIKLEQQVGGLQERLEELSQERGRAETFSRLQADYDKLAGQRNAWWQQLAEVKGQLTGEYLKLGQPDLSWLEKRQSAIDEQLKNLNYEIADLENQINRHQKIFSAKIARQAEALADFKELENKLLRLQKEFNSELGISNQEIRLAVNRLYSLQKDFIAQLKTAATLEALATIQAEAELIFAEMETFYRRLSQEKQHQASREISDLQSQLSGFLKNKDLLVNEINEVKIKLEVAVSQRQSLIGKAAELNLELEKVKSDLSSGQAKNQNELSNSLKQEKAALEKQLSELESKLTLVKGKIDNFNEEEEQKKQTIFTLQQQLYQLQAQLNLVVGSLNEIKVELARIDTKKEDLFSAMRHDLGDNYRPRLDSNLKGLDINECELKMSRLKSKLELIGGTDPEVEKEYGEVRNRYEFLDQQSQDLAKAIKDLEKVVMELDKMIKKQFEDEFKKINSDFSRYFKKLFDGGSAKLVLAQPQEEQTEAEIIRAEISGQEPPSFPLETALQDNAAINAGEAKLIVYPEDKSFLANMGIDIEACPPGKKIKNISVLSGGEKTMTALALICAIISNNPSPFILFDEVDAALDENNSAKFSDIIEELAHKTQFIIITHNRAIMARASVLYGVTMQGDGVSRLISLKLDEAKDIGK